MKVVFVYPAFGSLAIESLAAMARSRGHEVSLVFDPRLFDDSFVTVRSLSRLFSVKKRVVGRVVEEKPDLVAFSVVTSDVPWFREMGEMIRERTKAPIIAGNIHVTSAPEYVLKLDFVDAIVRGEGDHAIVEILDSLESGGIDPGIDNLGTRRDGEVRLNPLRPLIQDLDSLPFPDKSLYVDTPISARDIYTIMATRGCPYRCSFCNNSLMKSLYGLRGYVRTRSVGNVIGELEMAREKYGSKHVNFYDEVFGVSKKWLREFAEKYSREIALPYIACTNPNVVDDEYASLLAESGCTKVDLGVQTVNQQKRREIFNRRETTEKIRRAIETFKKHKIFIAAENIENYPSETEEDMVEMAEFYNETRPDVLKVFWLRYFPGTEIVDIGREHGVLSDGDVERINNGEDLGSITIDSSSPALHRKYYITYILTQVLPKSVAGSIIRRRLYRYFPVSFLPGIAYTVYRLFTKKSADAEIMMRQHAARYKFYLKRFFFPRSNSI